MRRTKEKISTGIIIDSEPREGTETRTYQIGSSCTEIKLTTTTRHTAEDIQQAFKDGLNRAAEHIAADVAAMPEPENYEVKVTFRGDIGMTLSRAKRIAIGNARDLFGSTFYLVIDRSVIGVITADGPTSFSFWVRATKKERHA
jgi:hypothetical protein